MAYTERKRETQRELMKRRRDAEREVQIGECANPKRRKACEKNLLKFLSTYFSEPPDEENYPSQKGLFHLKFSPVHLHVIDAFQARIMHGGQQALVAPRGFGKDSLAIGAAIWAALYNHSQFTVFACYEMSEAKGRIDEIKVQFEINKMLAADFPEVADCVRALDRAAQRARQQRAGGEFTRIEWGSEHIVLPNIKGFSGSGSVIAAASLGGSVRGMRINGRRPKFVIISDPQTRETANSPQQCEEVLRTIRADYGGLGDHSQSLSALALVTIIRRNDVADTLTDPARSPQWNGLRYKALESMPDREDLWEKYFDLRDEGARRGDATGSEATAFYSANKDDMDSGAVCTWPDAYSRGKGPDGKPLELSAIQHFMNLRWRDGEEAFLTEYQGDPPDSGIGTGLTPDIVCARLSLCAHSVAPPGMDRLVQGIDVRGREIHYVVMALGENGKRAIIDYDILRVNAPDGDLRSPQAQERPALELAVLDVLRHRRIELSGMSAYKTADGRPLDISLTLVDSGWLENVVYAFTAESGQRWRAIKGDQWAKGSKRYSGPQKNAPGVAVGNNWYAKRQASGIILFHVNADHWKMFTQERFLQTPDTAGACTIFGSDPKQHRLFSKHICAEEWNAEAQRFEQRSKFNHYLDCVAYCNAAAEMIGHRISGDQLKNSEASASMPRRSASIAQGVKSGGWIKSGKRRW